MSELLKELSDIQSDLESILSNPRFDDTSRNNLLHELCFKVTKLRIKSQYPTIDIPEISQDETEKSAVRMLREAADRLDTIPTKDTTTTTENNTLSCWDKGLQIIKNESVLKYELELHKSGFRHRKGETELQYYDKIPWGKFYQSESLDHCFSCEVKRDNRTAYLVGLCYNCTKLTQGPQPDPPHSLEDLKKIARFRYFLDKIREHLGWDVI